MYEDIDLGDGETIRVMNMLPEEYYRVTAPSAPFHFVNK